MRMRSSSLAGVVASLGVSVVITLGCGWLPVEPSPSGSFSVLSIFPTQGSTAGATTAWISGTGFRSHATVTVDGSRVEATVVDETTISLAIPAHAEGKVDVAVSQRPEAQTGVPGGYTYAFVVPPVISELLPNIGSTGGRTPMTIRGAGFQNGLTVMVGGRKHQNQYSGDHTLAKIFTDAHAAGTVDLIVTNPDGGQASSKFTYVSPATFDFNGVWQGIAQDWDGEVAAPFVLTIRDNIVVSLSCGASSLTLDPPPVVANGQFRFVASGGGSVDGEIHSPNYASGYITLGVCASSPYWSAEKR
jgi:nitrogen regulatory protein PII